MALDIFISEKPPRYDPEPTDPAAMKQKLSRYANGVLATASLPAERIILVEQTGLGRSSERARSDIYDKDGIHLTPRGLNMFTSNVIAAVRDYYGDIKISESKSPPVREHDQGQGRRDRRGDNRGSGRGNNNHNEQHSDHWRGGPRNPGRGDNWSNHRPANRWHSRGRGRGDQSGHWDYYGDEGYRGGYERGGRNRY